MIHGIPVPPRLEEPREVISPAATELNCSWASLSEETGFYFKVLQDILKQG